MNTSKREPKQLTPSSIADKPATLLVMAGGTGGHIYPGLAVADELSAKGWGIHWLGTADKMEAKIVPAHGYDISFINISGVRHKRLTAILTMPFKLLKSVIQAKRVIHKVKPDVVLGMGGYASAPGGLAAWLSNVPLIVHEQNAVAGLSNRLLSKIANTVCCAFPNAFGAKVTAQVVGNPLRAAIGKVDSSEQVKKTTNNSATKNVLVVGGSLGAQVLNETMPLCFADLYEKDHSFSIWHQTGDQKQAKVLEAYAEKNTAQNGLQDQVKVTEFINDMAAAYEWADLVICRAGALTVSELAMAGTPAIFVPLPHAVDDHQTKNAQYLVQQNAAKLLPQSELSCENVSKLIFELFNKPTTLKNMAESALLAANGDASENVAKLCQQLMVEAPSKNNEEKI